MIHICFVQLAKELKVPFYEVSAYTSENVTEMFASITGLVLKRFEGEVMAALAEKSVPHISDSDEEDMKEEGVVNDLKSREQLPSKESDEYSCCHIL